MRETLRPAIITLLVFTVVCGFLYPLVLVGVAGVIPHRTQVVGQPFDSPAYFWSRPTAAGNYDAMASAATNFGPGNPALTKEAQDRLVALHAADPGNAAPVPVDLVTSSASGLDPDISPEAALYQVGRVARARGISVQKLQALVTELVDDRTFGVLGEPRVNVVLLNRALDQRFGGSLVP
jgi:K+-transporting ATPase ATPase C chain